MRPGKGEAGRLVCCKISDLLLRLCNDGAVIHGMHGLDRSYFFACIDNYLTCVSLCPCKKDKSK